MAYDRAQGRRLSAKVAALLRLQKIPDIFTVNAELADELKRLYALPTDYHSTQQETKPCKQKAKISA